MASMDECWKDLLDSEQNTCDEYCGHVAISDWPGYDDAQEARRKEAWHWLDDRLEEIRKEIKNSSDNENHANHRYNRRDYLKAVVEDGYRKIHRVGPHYPSTHATNSEDVYIEEREYYLAWTSATDSQKQRKLDNLHWLEGRRKYVWRQAEGEIESDAGPGWDKKNRQQRYENLCIATHYGSAWEDYQKEQDKPDSGGGNGSTRHRLSEHFVIEEFDCNDGTKCGSREYNGLEYLCKTFLEPLRKKYGSVHINSGYRTPSYNASVGGASGSYHIYTDHDGDDQAADITCSTGSPSQWHSYLKSIRSSERGGKGGLGLYSTFVHIDIRDYQSDWTG